VHVAEARGARDRAFGEREGHTFPSRGRR
jgi:hypothetical protein